MALFTPFDAFSGYNRLFSGNAAPINGFLISEGALPGCSFAEMHPNTGDARAVLIGMIERFIRELEQEPVEDLPKGITAVRNTVTVPAEGIFRISYTITADYNYSLGTLKFPNP